jgi:trimeric autotransporter adhesin
LSHQGYFASRCGWFADARDLLQESLALLRQADDQPLIVETLYYLGLATYQIGEFEDSLAEPVRALVVSGANVYAGGELESAGGQVTKYLARWNGSAWWAIGVPNADRVDALAVGPAGGVYVGGEFITAGDKLANNVALWTGSAWNALGQGLTDFATSSSPGEPHAFAIDGAGRVYVGGKFETAGGMSVNNIAMCDGAKWNALGAGLEGGGGLDDSSVAALAIVGNDLYVGGSFTKAGGASA